MVDFCNLFLSPYLYFINFHILKNNLIQNNYNKIFFVSRDGYLPCLVYNKLKTNNSLSGEYIYGSRISYWTGIYSNYSELLFDLINKVKNNYTFLDFINAYVFDSSSLSQLKNSYTNTELNTTIKDNYIFISSLISRNKELFQQAYDKQKKLAKKYYSNKFKFENDKIVIFDVGYSGSISFALHKLTNKIIDKIYISEKEKNEYIDNQHGSYTFLLNKSFNSSTYSRFDLLLEELFSPLEGTCLGFSSTNDNTVEPILQEVKYNSEMHSCFEQRDKAINNFMENLINIFGVYIEHINIVNINVLLELADKIFSKDSNQKKLFENIIFEDKAVRHELLSLSKKI